MMPILLALLFVTAMASAVVSAVHLNNLLDWMFTSGFTVEVGTVVGVVFFLLMVGLAMAVPPDVATKPLRLTWRRRP